MKRYKQLKEEWDPLSSNYHDIKTVYNQNEINKRRKILKNLGYIPILLNKKSYNEIINLRNKYRPNIVFEFQEENIYGEKGGIEFIHYNHWGSWNITFSKNTKGIFWVKQ
jgi:hypothetical protein